MFHALYNLFLQELKFIARKKLKIHHSIMISMGTSLSSNPTSPIPDCPDHQSNGRSPVLPQSPPCWATQAWCDLAQAEAELHCLQERHASEIKSMKQGVERAILGARREEKRLLERVEQDHRDTQQHLEQVQRDNMTAAQVSQSLLEQRYHKLAQLQQQIQELGQQVWSGLDENLNLLLKEVAEFLQPWEISVSLKKVNFKPSPQPNAISFGDIRLQEQSLCLHARGFGLQGQNCAIHSHEMHVDTDHQSTGEETNTIGQGWTSSTGRVVRKIRLSTQNDLESEEEHKFFSTPMCLWLQKSEQSYWESSQDDEIESNSFQQQGGDVILTVPMVLKNMNTDDKEQVYKMVSNGKSYSTRNHRPLLTAVSCRKPPPSPERTWEHALSLDSQEGVNGKLSQDSKSRLLRYSNGMPTSHRMTPKEPLTSRSCLDLTSRSKPEHSLGTHGDSGRAPSPTDSLDSNYTFIVSPSHDYNVSRGSLNYNCRLSKSAVDLTHKTHPLIRGGTNEQVRVWRIKCGNFNPSSTLTSPIHGRELRVSNMGLQTQKKNEMAGSEKHLVAGSSSMSDSSKERMRGRGEKRESALVKLEEAGDQSKEVFNPRLVHLMRQFGKHGSGRADLTLPSGIHATPQGQLFIVDCGNARVQVCVIFNIFSAHTIYSMCTVPNVIDSNV